MDNLVVWEEIANKLSVRLSLEKNMEITSEMIVRGYYLCTYESNNYEWIPDVYDIETNEESVYNLIQNFEFGILLNETVLEDSLFPENLFMKKKVQVKVKNRKWIIHKYDKDPFPSSPHAHLIDEGLKLDLVTGILYRGKTQITKVREKELSEIRKEFIAKGVFLD
jgi:hypothetical protein